MAKLGEYADIVKDMSDVEVAILGATHLFDQSEKSKKSVTPLESHCVYNGPDGLCCGAAPFIKDYNESMEGEGWEEDMNPEVDHGLIRALQVVHDVYYVHKWKEIFIHIVCFGWSDEEKSFMQDFLDTWEWDEGKKRYVRVITSNHV